MKLLCKGHSFICLFAYMLICLFVYLQIRE